MRRNLWALFKGIIFTGFFVILIVWGVSLDLSRIMLPNFELAGDLPVISGMPINESIAESMLRENNVLMAVAGDEGKRYLSKFFTSQFPTELLVFNMRALATSDADIYVDGTEESTDSQMAEGLDAKQLNTEGDYFSIFQGHTVAIYCTHSGETYVPDSGAVRIDGGPGLVNQVAIHLGTTLKEKGLDSKFISTLHDYPEYQKSYTNSRKTVARVMASEGQRIIALFDVHRDSIPGVTEGQQVKINGKAAAPILIVVGTNERKNHPHWRENLAFAQDIYKEGQEMYPGLIKGVRTKSGTYNQEFFDHSLLLEFGTDYNTVEECRYSAELFAGVLLKVLKEEL